MFELRATSSGVDLVVTGSWSAAADDAVRSGKADGLVLNYALGYRERTLDFLYGLPLRRVEILARTLKDPTPLYSLGATLEQLRVQIGADRIDLRQLPHLRQLSAHWSQISETLATCGVLEYLLVLGYGGVDLTPLVENTRLETFVAKDRSAVKTLSGVESLGSLRHLDLSLSGVSDLTPLAEVSLLRVAEFESCGGIYDLSPLGTLTHLTAVNFSDCGPVESVRPLGLATGLQQIEMWGTTVVEDGDLVPIASLPELKVLRMRDRKHYAPQPSAIQVSIGDL